MPRVVRLPLTVLVPAIVGTIALASVRPRGDYPMAAVPITAVTIDDAFWSARLETNRRVTIPHIVRQNEITGRVANFARAARRSRGAYQGRRFNDTDVYKLIEAASFTLIRHPDPALDRQLDDLIAVIAAAQEPDGYLFPARTIDPAAPAPGVGPERWVHLNGSHELYNAGHLYEAAVAHHLATGKRTLLDVAVRNAELVRTVFGPAGRKAVAGHQEIELALVKLAAATGRDEYRLLARHFLDQRGRPHDTLPYPDGPFAMYNAREYKQDHLPVTEQHEAVGHAVRATYMYAAMTDVAALDDDAGYRRAVERLWTSVVGGRMYLTGGVGSRSGVEAFGDDYELPNVRAYTETCASIGFALWNHRMFRLTGEVKYLDLFERVLYNGTLSGVSISGDRFFYQNPLGSDGSRERAEYFDVACCPANLARLLAQLPGLVYAQRGRDVFASVYAGSRASLVIDDRPVTLLQRTGYPWTGEVGFVVETKAPVAFTLHLRVPGWARGEVVASDLYSFGDAGETAPSVTVNGEAVPVAPDRGFVRLARTWTSGDRAELHLPMPVRRVVAHEGIVDNRGKVALQRGPLVYALEGIDNDGTLAGLVVPGNAALDASFRADLLGGVTVVTARAAGRRLVAIPYFAWANRGKGEMTVWVAATARTAGPR